MYRFELVPICHSVGYQQCVPGMADGWITPTSDLGTFEQNCYLFGQNSTYWWSQASKQCIDSGGQLAVIETHAEFQWIMQVYAANFSSIDGFFVDATRNRYGTSSYTPAWRGGSSLSAGVETLFNNLTYNSGFNKTECYNTEFYNPEFYLTASGNLQEIYERIQILTNGGYMCKKFRSAPKPSVVGYNIGYCFPSLPSDGACPSGWTNYTPNSAPFCYQLQLSNISGVDEQFRNCHGIGADLVYLDTSAELMWLLNKGLMSSLYSRNDINAHRFRYGPAFTYSNGQNVTAITYYGINSNWWLTDNPDDWCGMESCLEIIAGTGGNYRLNDIACMTTFPSYPSASGVCKRPLCSTLKIMFDSSNILQSSIIIP